MMRMAKVEFEVGLNCCESAVVEVNGIDGEVEAARSIGMDDRHRQ